MRNIKDINKTSVNSGVTVKKDMEYAKRLQEQLKYKNRNEGIVAFNPTIYTSR